MPAPTFSTNDEQIAESSGPTNIFLRRGRYTRAGPSNSQDSDSFSAYRRMCELRTRRLERYKKCRSYCSLEANHQFPTGPGGRDFKFRLPHEHHKSASNLLDRGAGHDNAATPTAGSLSVTQTYPPHHSHFSRSSTDLTFCCPPFVKECHRQEELVSAPSGRAFLTGDSNFVVDPEGSPVTGAQTPPTPSTDAGPLGTIAQYNAEATGGGHHDVTNQFEVLREKMISLMENDVQLLQKLVTLGETIQDLRRNQRKMSSSGSDDGKSSLDGAMEETEAKRRSASESSLTSLSSQSTSTASRPPSRARSGETKRADGSTSAAAAAALRSGEITNLYVDDDDGGADSTVPNVQYFSRKNSVLRIPIPPRSSNRRHSIRQHPVAAHNSAVSEGDAKESKPRNSPEEDSGNSSASISPPAQLSPSGVADSVAAGSATTAASISRVPSISGDSGRATYASGSGSAASSRYSTFSSISSTSSASSYPLTSFIEEEPSAEEHSSAETLRDDETIVSSASSTPGGGCAAKCRNRTNAAKSAALMRHLKNLSE